MSLIVALIEDRTLGLAAMGAFAIMVGSVLSWIRVPQPLIGTATGYGLQEDGKITIVLGALALGLVLAYGHLRQRDLAIGAGLAGLGAAAFAAVYAADLTHNAARVLARLLAGDQPPIDPGQIGAFPARVGPGIFVILAGAVLLVLSVVAITIRARGTIEPARRSSD